MMVSATLFFSLTAPLAVHADDGMSFGGVVAADVATTDGDLDDAVTTTTIVASEAPRAGAGGLAPEIGPIIVPTDGSSFSGAWWLVAFGGLQLIGLFFVARRARARLSTEDART